MPTTEKIHLRPAQVRPFSMDGAAMADLATLGITFDAATLAEMQTQARTGYSMDAAPAFATAASAGSPMQFLQTLLPDAVHVVTAARKIDIIAGRTVAGQWSDEEIIMAVIEYTGNARVYGDSSAAALSDFVLGYERRHVVRFEEGAHVGKLESERAAAMKQNAQEHKRAAAATVLAVEANRVGFYGYNDGNCRTYGFLTDPSLTAYSTLPGTGAGGSTKWKDKGFDPITDDIRIAMGELRTASGDLINPEEDECTMVVATSCREWLTKTNQFGQSVSQWLAATYPKLKVESAPELNGANGGQNVFYLFAITVPGVGEAGRQRVLDHIMPAALHLVGMERGAKGALEVYSNATAGCIWRVPFACRRYSGI